MPVRTTLKDIALKSGYSRSTVSLVMQNSPIVADDTRAAVQQAAEELGYVYNRAAASLRSKQSGIFGLIVNNVANPFFGEIAIGVERILSEGERTVLLGQHSESLHAQERMIKSMLEARVDGILLVAAYDTPRNVFESLQKWNIPTVLLTRRIKGFKLPYVGTDNVAGAKAATDHLFQHKRSQIALIGGRVGTPAHEERKSGVYESARENNYPLDKVAIIGESATRIAGYNAVKQLIASGQKDLGILAYNDLVAYGASAALRDAGLRIGKDVSLIGIDDVEGSKYENPALTSVHIDSQKIGEKAAELVLAIASSTSLKTKDVILGNTLNVRESCGCTWDMRSRT